MRLNVMQLIEEVAQEIEFISSIRQSCFCVCLHRFIFADLHFIIGYYAV